MKILFVNNFYTPNGGAETYLSRISALMRANGHQTSVFASDCKPFFHDIGIETKSLPRFIDYPAISRRTALKNIIRPLYNREADRKLSRVLLDYQPDVVHLNIYSFLLSNSVLFACNRLHVPVVITLHNAYAICPAMTLLRGYQSYCRDAICLKQSPLHCIVHRCYHRSLVKSTVATLDFIIRRKSLKAGCIKFFISPSKALFEQVADGGLPREKCLYIPNSVDHSYIDPGPVACPREYFLYVGRFPKEKGLEVLLHALQMLPKEILLHVVGEGKELQTFTRLADNLAPDRVRFLGYCDGEKLRNEYDHCIATVVPSIWFEVFGLTIIEAFARGRPVIGSSIGAIPEIIDNEITGLCVPPGDARALAQAMARLFYNPELTDRLGQEARKRILSHFHPDQYFDKMIAVYRRASAKQDQE